MIGSGSPYQLLDICGSAQLSSLLSLDTHSTFGSRNKVGFGSRIEARSSPLAWIGDRGTTTLSPAAPKKKPCVCDQYAKPRHSSSSLVVETYLWTLRMVQSAVSHTHARRTYRQGPSIQGILAATPIVLFGRFVDDLSQPCSIRKLT